MKLCKTCGKPFEGNSYKYCSHECFLVVKRNYAKKRHESGKRTLYKKTCAVCSLEWLAWRQCSEVCPKCYRDGRKTGYVNNQYKTESRTSKNEHRIIAEKLLGRKLSYNEVCHHVDEDVKNNSLLNLWVMSRHHHGSLHSFLRMERIKLNNNDEWENQIKKFTDIWLEIKKPKIIKLSEINLVAP